MSLISPHGLERGVLFQAEITKRASVRSRPFVQDLEALWKEGAQSPFALEWRKLACQGHSELFSQDLLALAFQIESQGDPQVALKIFAYLAEDPRFAKKVRQQAQSQLELWQGKGTLGARAAHWLRFLPQEVLRGETAASLLLGAGGFGLGLRVGQRFFGGARGLGRTLAVGATAWVGEATAMSLGYGAVQTWHGQRPDFAGLWIHSLAMSGAYRGMGWGLGRFSQVWRRNSPVLSQELGRFTGILGVQAFTQALPLNLGGGSTAQDTLFNSFTAYLNFNLHRGLFATVAPRWNPVTMPKHSQSLLFHPPRLPKTPKLILAHLGMELAPTTGAYKIGSRGPTTVPEIVGALKSEKVQLPKGSVLSLAENKGPSGKENLGGPQEERLSVVVAGHLAGATEKLAQVRANLAKRKKARKTETNPPAERPIPSPTQATERQGPQPAAFEPRGAKRIFSILKDGATFSTPNDLVGAIREGRPALVNRVINNSTTTIYITYPKNSLDGLLKKWSEQAVGALNTTLARCRQIREVERTIHLILRDGSGNSIAKMTLVKPSGTVNFQYQDPSPIGVKNL